MRLFNILKQASSPRRLHNWFFPIGGFGNRPTSANIPSDNFGGVRKFLVTNSMTEGKPLGNGHILNLDWDNSNLYSAQLYLTNGVGEMFHRALASADGWTQWYRVLSEYNTADWVVAEGVDGVWTYRKWNSGKCECWGKVTTTNAINTQEGSFYISSALPFALPSGLFVDASKMNVVASKATYNSNNGLYGTAVNTTHVTLSWFRGQSLTGQTLDANVYIIGTWK